MQASDIHASQYFTTYIKVMSIAIEVYIYIIRNINNTCMPNFTILVFMYMIVREAMNNCI